MEHSFFTKLKKGSSRFLEKPEHSFFTLRRSMSRRFFQLSFEGFRPSGRNKLERFINTWLEFFRALIRFIFRKILDLFLLIIYIIGFLLKTPAYIKSFIVRKLIWSRGKLGRLIIITVVVGVSMTVFLLGEIFSSSPLVVDQPVSADYLVSTNDIIPKREIAVTTLPEERKGTEPFVYKVQPGDSLYSIGTKFKIATDALQYINGLTDNSVLSVGQDLTIPPVAGLIHKVQSGDTLSSIAEKYGVPSQAIADFNYILDTTHLALGTELVIPGGKIPKVVIQPVIPTGPVNTSRGPAGTVDPNNSLCIWPTTVHIITQNFSWYHNGVDIATPYGAMPPLLACDVGVVVRAGWDPWGLGLHVRIDHGNGFLTIYGHMSRLDVSYGQKVKRGQVIGLMGSTGNSTGPHVHYIVEYNGVPQNPLNFTR